MPQLIIELSDTEMQAFREMSKAMEPENVTPEQHAFYILLRELRVYLAGKVAGMEATKTTMLTAIDSVFDKAEKQRAAGLRNAPATTPATWDK